MKINFHWPKTKERPHYNPWYIILWRFLMYPLAAVSGALFYVITVLFWMDTYQAERFRKEHF